MLAADHQATPFVRQIVRAELLREPFFDASVHASAARLRRLDVPLVEDDARSESLVSSASLIETPHGGSIRTFNGNLPHENGWWPSWRRQRNLFWQGEAARDFIVRSESDPLLEWVQSEPFTFSLVLDSRLQRYTPDILVKPAAGPLEVVEIKRDEDDLWDEDYRRLLGAVAELCRRIGRVFKVVLEDEIYQNRHHRANCELFASRRYVAPTKVELARLEAQAMRDGAATSYGELAEVLAPASPAAGKGVIQSLAVRNRVEIDLTTRLDDSTPVRIC